MRPSVRLGAILLAAALAVASAADARADSCNWQGVVTIAQGAVGDIPECTGIADNPALLTGAIAMGTGLAIDGGTDAVCPSIDNIISKAQQAPDPLGYIDNALSQIPAADGLLGQLESSAKDFGDPLGDAEGMLKCGCKVATFETALFSLAGDCLSDLFCFLGNNHIVGQPCQCQGATPTYQANCYQTACSQLMPPPGFDESQCNTVIVRSNPECGSSNYYPAETNTTPVGTIVVQGGPSTGSCAPINECFCPQPMTLQWVGYQPGGSAVCGSGSAQGLQFQMALCQCPAGSSLAQSPPGPSGPVCLCDNGPDAGKPIPPGGQCASVCPQTQVPIAGGGCCDPAQVAACGVCCSTGQIPDPNTGTCMPMPKRPFPSRR